MLSAPPLWSLSNLCTFHLPLLALHICCFHQRSFSAGLPSKKAQTFPWEILEYLQLDLFVTRNLWLSPASTVLSKWWGILQSDQKDKPFDYIYTDVYTWCTWLGVITNWSWWGGRDWRASLTEGWAGWSVSCCWDWGVSVHVQIIIF